MIIFYIQTNNPLEVQKISNMDNHYIDFCPSIIPFVKREKGSLVFALINQKKVSKVIVPSISVLGRNQIDVLNTIDFFINNDVSLISQAERLETMDEYGRVKSDTILFLNLFRSSLMCHGNLPLLPITPFSDIATKIVTNGFELCIIFHTATGALIAGW